ncbi:MAG: hypothetical protein M1837_002101, partial [Sclerophora amabilis]
PRAYRQPFTLLSNVTPARIPPQSAWWQRHKPLACRPSITTRRRCWTSTLDSARTRSTNPPRSLMSAKVRFDNPSRLDQNAPEGLGLLRRVSASSQLAVGG